MGYQTLHTKAWHMSRQHWSRICHEATTQQTIITRVLYSPSSSSGSDRLTITPRQVFFFCLFLFSPNDGVFAAMFSPLLSASASPDREEKESFDFEIVAAAAVAVAVICSSSSVLRPSTSFAEKVKKAREKLPAHPRQDPTHFSVTLLPFFFSFPVDIMHFNIFSRNLCSVNKTSKGGSDFLRT